jgi:hypothetical protein
MGSITTNSSSKFNTNHRISHMMWGETLEKSAQDAFTGALLWSIILSYTRTPDD